MPTYSQKQIDDDANDIPHAKPPTIADHLAEIQTLARACNAAQIDCVVTPDCFSYERVIAPKLKAALSNPQSEGHAEHLRVEAALAEFRELHAQMTEWSNDQRQKRDAAKARDRLAATRHNLASQWTVSGDGKPLFDALTKGGRDLEAARGALLFGSDLPAWRDDIAKVMSDMLATIDAAIEAIQPKSSSNETREHS